jgi:beta-lactam-binding protein with PASTA domain
MAITRILKSVVKAGLIAGSFIAVVLFSAYVVILVVTRAGGEVEVPDVVGEGYYDASRRLHDCGLRLAARGEEYSPIVPKDHIMYQEPAAGSMVRKSRVVRVTVSKGSENIAVPDLSGEELRQVGGKLIIPPKLRQSRLQVGHISAIHYPAKGGLILAQNPSPKTPIEVGGKVNLLVSAGPRRSKYLVPDVVGKKLDEAVQILSQLNLQVQPEREYRPRAEPNVVLKQNPLPNEILEEGGAVVLTISAPQKEKRWQHLRYLVVEYQVPLEIPPKTPRLVRIEMTDVLGTETVLLARFDPGTVITEVISYKEKATVKVFVEGVLRQQTEADDSRRRTYLLPDGLGETYEAQNSPVNPFRRLR